MDKLAMAHPKPKAAVQIKVTRLGARLSGCQTPRLDPHCAIWNDSVSAPFARYI